MNKQKKSLVVYTALFGNYDILIDPRAKYDNCDFLCFTDQNHLNTKIWKQVKVSKSFPSPVAANRHFKWLPHRYLNEYEVSLYLDSNILLYVDPKVLIDKYLAEADIAMPRHPFRNCIYKEALSLIYGNKVTFCKICQQIKHYRQDGYPCNHGLMEQGIILRRHNKKNLVHVMEKQWFELQKWGNYRDQIAFPYIMWKYDVNVSLIKENARNNISFIYLPHKKSSVSTIKKILIAIRLRKRRYIDSNLLRLIMRFANKGA